MDDEVNKVTRYWGGIDEIMKELFYSPSIEHTNDEVAAASDIFIASSQAASHPHSSSDTPPDSSPNSQQNSSSGFQPESLLNSGKPDISQASPALGQEIKALRYRYLSGKLAGQDLVDETGNIIIRKNEPITSEIVDLADRVGKLAELIVNMTIPELVE